MWRDGEGSEHVVETREAPDNLLYSVLVDHQSYTVETWRPRSLHSSCPHPQFFPQLLPLFQRRVQILLLITAKELNILTSHPRQYKELRYFNEQYTTVSEIMKIFKVTPQNLGQMLKFILSTISLCFQL